VSLVVLATGGTGGHIYPALATAHELLRRGFRVAFIGQEGGLEARVIPADGLPFYGVRAGKWHRGRPDPRQAVRATFGLGDAVTLLRRLRPSLVLGFGGFASFPALAAARVLGVPYALHEQNVFPGKVVRWFAGGARFIAVAAAETQTHLEAPVEPVGLPVREVRVDKRTARRRLGLPETGLVTLVMGGSQGSVVLNQAVPKAFAALQETVVPETVVPETVENDLFVLHSSGPANLETTRRAARDLSNYRVDGYLDGVLAWSAADLGVTRSGNGTLAEAAFYGVPLVMVPLPSAAENHQLYNAKAVAEAGAGVVVQEQNLGTLTRAWAGLLEVSTLEQMSMSARLRSPEGAAARLAGLVERTLETAPKGRQTQMQESL